MGFVRGNLRGRGLRGYVPGGMALPVYKFNGLGCACKKRGMGADDLYTGLNPDGSVDTSWIPAGNMPNAVTSVSTVSNANPYDLPGLTNGPVYPSAPASSSNPNLYNVPGAPAGTVYNASLNINVPKTGVLGASGLGGISATTLYIAGGLLVALVAFKKWR
jgi:hypothetical protein